MKVSNDQRVQLLANLKCLYGPDVEVFTLCVLRDKYQAVAIRSIPFTTTWTKFLHSKLAFTSRDAIDALLEDSEKELAKFFSTSGIALPFEEKMEQTFTLCRGGQRRDSSSGDSARSDHIIVATSASTFLDTGSDTFAQAEQPVEVTASEEPLVDETPVAEQIEVVPDEVAEQIEVVPDEVAEQIEVVPDDAFGWGSLGKKDKKKKGKAVVEEPEPVPPVVEDDM
ncbi:hypothetical protein BJ875DRAFT_490150, partial [Amylocarpus encephaloides]